MARKLHDYDAELQALMDKAKGETQKTTQLGELVQVTDLDTLPLEALAGALLAPLEQSKKQPKAVARWTERGQAFFQAGGKRGAKTATGILLAELQATAAQLQRLTVLRNRLELARIRDIKPQWVQDRRARTRHLSEFGAWCRKPGWSS